MIRQDYLDAARHMWGNDVRYILSPLRTGHVRVELVRPGQDNMLVVALDAAHADREIERMIKRALVGHVDWGQRMLRRMSGSDPPRR